MNNTSRTFFLFLLFLLIQITISNYIYSGPYIYISILPILILYLPTKLSNITGMLIAALFGFLVDWLADGVWGLNMLSLIPVAYLKKNIVSFCLGSDVIVRNEIISFSKSGFSRISTAIMLCQLIFLGLYIIFDGNAIQGHLFNFIRFICSLSVNFILSIPLAYFLSNEFSRYSSNR